MSVALTTPSSASSSGASSNYDACLGDARITPSTVDGVVTDLIKRLDLPYRIAVEEGELGLRGGVYSERFYEGFIETDNYKTDLLSTELDINTKRRPFSVGKLVLPCFSELNKDQQRYFIDVGFEGVAQINERTPLGALVNDLY